MRRVLLATAVIAVLVTGLIQLAKLGGNPRQENDEHERLSWRVSEAIPTTQPRGGSGDFNLIQEINTNRDGADVLLYEFATRRECSGRVIFHDNSPDTLTVIRCYDRDQPIRTFIARR